MISMLHSVFKPFFPSAAEEIEEIDVDKPEVAFLIHVDGNTQTVDQESTVEAYKEKHFSADANLVCVSFGTNEERVLYDPYVTQPPEFYNAEASFQTQIDIYGPALILRHEPSLLSVTEIKKPSRKRKPQAQPVKRRKSARLQAKEDKK